MPRRLRLTRPVIVIKKYNQYSFLALPFTAAQKLPIASRSESLVAGKSAFAALSQLRNIEASAS
jgi:hypothetical protein